MSVSLIFFYITKYSPQIVAQNNKHLLSHSFSGSGIQTQRIWMVCLRVSCEVALRIPVWAAIIWRLGWTRGQASKMAGAQGAVTGRRPWVLHTWTSPPASWGPSWHGCWLPPGWSIQEGKAKAICLLWPSLRSHTLPFPQYPISYRGQPHLVLDRLHRTVTTRKKELLGGGAINMTWISRKITKNCSVRISAR